MICSDTPDHLDVKANQVERQDRHNGLLGFKDHFIITLDGKVHKGRDQNVQGFKVNSQTLTIQMIGRKYFNEHQKVAIKKLIETLKEQYGSDLEIINTTTIEKL